MTPGALAIAQAQVVESLARLMLVMSRMDGDQLDRLPGWTVARTLYGLRMVRPVI